MKRILSTAVLALLFAMTFAQIPQIFSYQAVVRDANNNLVASKPLGVELSILQGSDDGALVYTEKHIVTSNPNGLISLEMGAGVSRDDFSAIDWSNAPYFVKTEIEVDGKNIVGITPLLAVPYALFAVKAGNVNVDLTDYAKKTDIPNLDLSEYALKSEIPAEVDLTDYAKKSDVDLTGYYSKEEIDALLAELESKIGNGGGGGSSQQGNVAVENGAIKAGFSVSAYNKVYFSQGNLQYQASTGTWRFAEHQYDIIGNNNSYISSSYNGWIDLFVWGTSGWNSGANAYQPYSTSTSHSDYYPGGDYTNNLTGSYANADWGVYNKISNGGNATGMWRTLTNDEWYYVINTRANASSKKGVASVNGVNGLILLPDEWTLPEGIVFTSGAADDYGSEYYATVNSYTASEWAKMEANGAVFLPAAGYRDGTGVNYVGSYGYYWSSSAYDYGDASCLDFGSGYVYTNNDYRYDGRSVRLVRGL